MTQAQALRRRVGVRWARTVEVLVEGAEQARRPAARPQPPERHGELRRSRATRRAGPRLGHRSDLDDAAGPRGHTLGGAAHARLHLPASAAADPRGRRREPQPGAGHGRGHGAPGRRGLRRSHRRHQSPHAGLHDGRRGAHAGHAGRRLRPLSAAPTWASRSTTTSSSSTACCGARPTPASSRVDTRSTTSDSITACSCRCSSCSALRLVNLSVVRDYDAHRTIGRLVPRDRRRAGARRAVRGLRRPLASPAAAVRRRATTRAARGSTRQSSSCSRVGDLDGLSRLDPDLVRGAGECGLRSFIALGAFLGGDDDSGARAELRRTVRGRLCGGRPSERRRERRETPSRARRRSAIGCGGVRSGPADYARRCVEAFVARTSGSAAARRRALRGPGGLLLLAQEARRAARLHRHPDAGRALARPRDRPQRLRRRLSRSALSAGRRRTSSAR